MEVFDFKIRVPVEIHVRNALMLSQKTSKYVSDIMLHKGKQAVNAKKLMDIMILRVKCGDEVRFVIEGLDEKEAFAEIWDFCDKNL